jgi:hypothetical protein
MENRKKDWNKGLKDGEFPCFIRLPRFYKVPIKGFLKINDRTNTFYLSKSDGRFYINESTGPTHQAVFLSKEICYFYMSAFLTIEPKIKVELT